jgi:hypothetical protein
MRPRKRLVLTNTADPPAGAILWPTDSAARNEWRDALEEMRDGFRRAYQQRPATARERAVVLLVDLLAGREQAPARLQLVG